MVNSYNVLLNRKKARFYAVLEHFMQISLPQRKYMTNSLKSLGSNTVRVQVSSAAPFLKPRSYGV